MTSELQERIAKAMFIRWIEVSGRYPCDFSDLDPEAMDEWRHLALAAMKAAREPTSVMVEGGWNSGVGVEAIYMAMIDAEIAAAEGDGVDE
ncbi:hypothetical protein [Xanthobacter sp. ZOL 2024]